MKNILEVANMVYWLLDWIDKKVDAMWYDLTTSKEQKRLDEAKNRLPFRCRTCEFLGMCRDSDNDWKCMHGCLIIKGQNGR